MKTKETKNVECANVVENAANVITIDDATAKLYLQVGAVFEFEGKRLEITGKRSNSEDNPTQGGKTLWSGNIDGVEFVEVDVCKLRKMFGLQPRKREASAGKTFEYEGNVYSLDETADAMISGAFARYNELKTLLDAFCVQYGIVEGVEPEEAITAKIEAVCLARQIAKTEAEKAKQAEKEAKAKASKQHREKVKEAKTEFFALLSAGIPFAEVTAKIAEKYGLQVSDLA